MITWKFGEGRCYTPIMESIEQNSNDPYTPQFEPEDSPPAPNPVSPTGPQRGGPRSPTSPAMIEIRERDRQAMELRLMGYDFRQIAQTLGFASHSGAYEAVKRGMEATIQEPSAELRKAEIERLRQLYNICRKRIQANAAADDKVAQGWIQTCLKLHERIAKMEGLDRPAQIEFRGAVAVKVDDLSDDELTRIIREGQARSAALAAGTALAITDRTGESDANRSAGGGGSAESETTSPKEPA